MQAILHKKCKSLLQDHHHQSKEKILPVKPQVMTKCGMRPRPTKMSMLMLFIILICIPPHIQQMICKQVTGSPSMVTNSCVPKLNQAKIG